MDCSWSEPSPYIEGLQPNQLGLVLFGSVVEPALVVFYYNFNNIIESYYRSNYIMLKEGTHHSGVTAVKTKCINKTSCIIVIVWCC